MTNCTTRETTYKSLVSRLGELYDYQCAKIAGLVGTGIHLYSTAINDKHFQSIYEDFTNEQYIRGTLKATVPFLLPYCVSLYSRKKAKREVQEKINDLELKIKQLYKKHEDS